MNLYYSIVCKFFALAISTAVAIISIVVETLGRYYVKGHENLISFRGTSVHIPTDLYHGSYDIKNDLHWTKNVDTLFQSALYDDPDKFQPTWQYFAMASGVFRLYPMSPFGMSKVYDSRLQDWYINTATSSKSVVLALDSSGSVTGSVYKLIRQTAITLLDTLNDQDYVSIVFFNDQVHPLVKCAEFENSDRTKMRLKFVQATPRNQEILKELVWVPFDTRNIAKFENMFKLTYEAFEVERSIRGAYTCSDILMVVSDGGEGDTEAMFTRLGNSVNKNVRVFTYVEGPASYKDYYMQWVACNTKGLFHAIPTMEAVHSNSVKYISILSKPLAIQYHKRYKLSEALVQRWTTGQLGLVWSLTCPVINVSSSITNFFGATTPPMDQTAGNTLLGVTGVDVILRDLSQYFFPEKLGPNAIYFIMNSKGNLQLHPVLKFFTVHNFEHHQLKIQFRSAFKFVNHTEGDIIMSMMLNENLKQTHFSADMYINVDLYSYRRKALFDVFRYKESRYHEMLVVGIAHFSNWVLQVDSLNDKSIIIPVVQKLLSRANPRTNSECVDQQKNALDWSSPCGKIYISPWPYCPAKVNWTSEDQNILLEEVRQLILHGFDSNSCNFAHDQHDDSQLLQNLVASLYLVNKFFSFKKPPTKSDFIITFGGVSATLNLSLARSDWWQHVANPKESSLYQRTLLMAEFFNDKDLILVSTDNEPGHTADEVVCAGISARNFEYKHGALAVTQQIYNNQMPEIGIYGQVIDHHELLDDSFHLFDQKCGTEYNCYALDEGASVIGFVGVNRHLDDEGLGDHLIIHNPCLVKSLVNAGIYENYIYDDAFCFCPEVLPEKPKFNSASSKQFTNIFTSSSVLLFKMFSLLLNLLNFAFWSSCQNMLIELFSSIPLAAEGETKDILFNYRIENQLSLCNVAFDKYIYTDKVPYLLEKTAFLTPNWRDFDETCSSCSVNNTFQIQRLLKTNLIMISLSASEDFCGTKRYKLEQYEQYWKKPKNICLNNKEDEYSAPVNCPTAIHELETSDPGNIYCLAKSFTSIKLFYLCAFVLCFRTTLQLS